LALLGRGHSPAQAIEAVRTAQASGFANISLDLIYGIPGQTMDSWRANVEQAIALGVTHASGYCLSFEPGTPLGADLAEGRVAAVDDALQRDCYEWMIDRFAAAGLAQYEISNFAAAGRECRHNLTYWHNMPYMGIGPAAVSYVAGRRSVNQHDLGRYVARITAGLSAEQSGESVTGRLLQAETLMLELRLRSGVDRRAFAARFGIDPAEAFSEPIFRFADLGFVTVTSDRIFLNRNALFVADSILAEIVAAAGH
jgi:oxygen-independent coproporphyrinogen-3 oxidase